MNFPNKLQENSLNQKETVDFSGKRQKRFLLNTQSGNFDLKLFGSNSNQDNNNHLTERVVVKNILSFQSQRNSFKERKSRESKASDTFF